MNREEDVMIPQPLKKLLDENHIKYAVIHHSPAYTAQEIAASAHIHGVEMAKTVIVILGTTPAMVVLPASKRVSMESLERVTARKGIRLAEEDEFVELFPDGERGAMPPFGNLYGVETYLDRELAAHDMIAFNAGTHTEVLRMHYGDYARLAMPKVLSLAA